MYLKLNGKVPREKGPWKLHEDLPDGNVGKILIGETLVDFDNGLESAREFYKICPDLCTVISRTRRGIHFFFKGETKSRQFEHGDIKSGEHAYAVIPPSVVDGHEYRWIRRGELQPFPEHLFPQLEKGATTITREVRDAIQYVMRIESIQDGSSNKATSSRGLVRACSVLRDAGLSEAEATIRMLEWNNGPTVSPKWSHQELARAITRTYAKGK
jgi:hypothetical protein